MVGVNATVQYILLYRYAYGLDICKQTKAGHIYRCNQSRLILCLAECTEGWSDF